MAEQDDFERIKGWIGRFNACVDEVLVEKDATHTLVDSAEYELGQLKRQIRRPPSTCEAHAQRREPGRTPEGVFNIKLRSPDAVRTPQWWAALGLNE